MLPLTMPGIIAAAILTFIPAMGDYVTRDLLGGADNHIAKVAQVLFLRPRPAVWRGAGVMLMVITLAGTFWPSELRQETFG